MPRKPQQQSAIAKLFSKAVAAQGQGRIREALEAYNRIVAQVPTHFEAWYNRGLLLQMLQKLSEACDSYRRALTIAPDSPEVHYQLGLALSEQGQSDAAIAQLTQAVALRSSYAEAHYALGYLYQNTGKGAQAVDAYRRATILRPDWIKAHFGLASSLEMLGEHEAAIVSYEQVLALDPNFVNACFKLGYLLQFIGQYAPAANYYQRGLALAPEHAEGLANLGLVYLHLQRTTEGIALQHRALALKPGYIRAYFNLGSAYAELGKYAEATLFYRSALQMEPHNLDALGSLASVLERQGDLSAAAALLEPLPEYRHNTRVALACATIKSRNGERSAARQVLEERLATGMLPVQERQQLLFSLADVCDSLQCYDDAFRYAAQANALKTTGFDPGDCIAQFDALIAAFSSTALARLQTTTLTTQVPIFIVGMPRSGTSLVEQILACHPAVYGAGELDDLPQLVQTLPATLGSSLAFPACLEHWSSARAEILASQHLKKLEVLAPRALRITDKLPHNFLFLGLVQLLFPGARIIHCLRDPLDTCLSCYFKDFGQRLPYSYDLEHLAVYYAQYRRLMAHWQQVLALPIFDVRYEELVANQEAVSRSLLAFCGLEWHDACLQFHRSERVVRTASYHQVRQPLYGHAVQRSRHYLQHLGPLLGLLEA